MVLHYFNVLENIAQNSLVALSKVTTDQPGTSPIVVGGMAIQLHCLRNSNLLRPTCDIDLYYSQGIEDFASFSEGIGGEVKKVLLKKGYQINLKRSRNSYEVKVMVGQNANAKELFFIHFDYVSNPELYSTIKVISDRMASNASPVEVSGTDRPVLVTRIEDILPWKIDRIKKSLSKSEHRDPLHHSLYSQAQKGNWSDLARMSLDVWCDELTQMQNEFPQNQKVHPNGYVISKDLYDLCLLSRTIEGTPGSFNRAYYLTVKKDVENIK